MNLKITAGVLTAGTGGTAPTPRPTDLGDAAATTTARANDTTQATTSTSFVNLFPIGGHIYGGWNWNMIDSDVWFGPTQGIVFELLAAPAASVELSGGLEFLEVG